MKAIVPILDIDARRTFPLEAYDALAETGLVTDDEFTFTFRVTAAGPQRDALQMALRRRLPPVEAEQLIRLLEECEYDVSFYADTF